MDESLRIEHALQQMAHLIRRHTPSNGTYQTPVPSLTLMHAIDTSEPLESVYKPSICVVAQGAKTATQANETYRYDPSTYVVTSVELPIVGRIVEASPEIPYLSIKLSFDADIILDMAKQTDRSASVPVEAPRGITLNRTSPELLEAIVRLMQLLDSPEDAPILAPLVIREILYRVLQGEQGALIRQFAVIGSHAYSISRRLRESLSVQP